MTVEESFHEYVRGRAAALSRVAYMLTGDFHLAEDLVQSTVKSQTRHALDRLRRLAPELAELRGVPTRPEVTR